MPLPPYIPDRRETLAEQTSRLEAELRAAGLWRGSRGAANDNASLRERERRAFWYREGSME